MERLTIRAGVFGNEELFVLRDSQKYKVMYYDKGEEKCRYNFQLIINRLGLVEDALEIYEKALKLACECHFPKEHAYDYFIEQAKESIK